MADVSIYWFRDDLRLSDLPGLQAARQEYGDTGLYPRRETRRSVASRCQPLVADASRRCGMNSARKAANSSAGGDTASTLAAIAEETGTTQFVAVATTNRGPRPSSDRQIGSERRWRRPEALSVPC